MLTNALVRGSETHAANNLDSPALNEKGHGWPRFYKIVPAANIYAFRAYASYETALSPN